MKNLILESLKNEVESGGIYTMSYRGQLVIDYDRLAQAVLDAIESK
jgi:hypothetical protein